MGNWIGKTEKTPSPSSSSSPTGTTPFSPPTSTTPFSPPTSTTPFSPPTSTTPFSPPTSTTPFSPPTSTTPFSPPTSATPFSPPTRTNPVYETTRTSSFSSPTRTTPLSPQTTSTTTLWNIPTTTSTAALATPLPTTMRPRQEKQPTTGTNRMQHTTNINDYEDLKNTTVLQSVLLEIIQDISTAKYCPDYDVVFTTAGMVINSSANEALSLLLDMYPGLPSEKQIFIFHLFLNIKLKHPDILLNQVEEELFLPHNGLLYFHKNKEWILLAYLIVGIQGYPDSLFYKMADEEDTYDLTLVEILNEYSANIPKWVDLLIERILVNGAPCEYLCAFRKAPALHVAAEIAAVSGNFQTFSYVLQWASASKDQLNARDRKRQTAFERICGLVDKHPVNSKRVLIFLLKYNCELPHNTFGSCDKILVECTKEEINRLRQNIECAIENKNYKEVAIQRRRGADLLLCCHRVKDLSEYYEGLFLIHLKKKDNICVKKSIKMLKSAHHTFAFLDYLENGTFYPKIKEIDKGIDAIFKNIHKMEEEEVNKFLLEMSKSPESWPMLHFFLVGTKSQGPRFKKFDASQMNISTLLELRKSDKITKSSALELLMILLRNGLLSGHDSSVKIHKILQLSLNIGSLDALDYCLNNNNINVVNAKNETLLHSLVQSEVNGVQFYINVMKLLLKKGINKSVKDSKGQKAEDLATILNLSGALLKVENINCCDNLGNLMDQVKKLESSSNKQLLASYCTVGMSLLMETNVSKSNATKLVKFCTTSAKVCFALRFKMAAETDLASAVGYCNSVQDILLVSDVYYGQGNYKMALKYCGEAYKSIPHHDENDIKLILNEIVKVTVDGLNMTSFTDFKTKPHIYDECRELECVFLQYLPLVFTIGNEAAKRGENVFGAFAVNTFYTYWPFVQKDVSKIIDLKQLHTSILKMDVMHKLLVEFVKQDFDLRKLLFCDGETYLHSCVKLSLYYGYFELLELIINNRTIEKNELHIMDNNMRTAFDLLQFNRDGEFHEETQNIMLQALMQVPSKKKISMSFPNPVYLYHGDGVVFREDGWQGTTTRTAAAVRKIGTATAAVGKTGTAAAVVKQGAIAAAVGKIGTPTAAAVGKIGTAAAVGKIGTAVSKTETAAVGMKKTEAAVGKKGAIAAAVGKIGTPTAAAAVGKIGTAAVSKAGTAAAAAGNGKSMTTDDKRQIPTTISSTGAAATTAVEEKAKRTRKRRGRIMAGKWSDGKGRTKVYKRSGTKAGSRADAAQGRVPGNSTFKSLLKLYKSNRNKYDYLEEYFIVKDDKHQLSEDFLKDYNQSTLCDKKLKVVNVLPDIIPTTEKRKKRRHRKKNSKIANTKQEASEELKKNTTVKPQPQISEPETRLEKQKSQEHNALKFVPETLEREMKANIESLTEYKFEEINSVNMKFKEKEKNASETITKSYKKVDICLDVNPDVIKDCEQSDFEDDGDYEDDQNEDFFKEEHLFENLNWKVVCTQDVWNTLKSRDLSDKIRRQTISAIIKLASGDKTRHVRKVKDIPQGLKLYTFHLSHYSCILWQLTIMYVPELEQYSEVLCICQVVFNLNKLKSIIDDIVKCYKASLSRPKSLKPVVSSTPKQSGNWLPRVFEKCNTKSKDVCQSYLSIDNENELNIVKFYRFSSSLVRYIFEESMSNASFPFEVKEAESDIVADNSEEALIVLGRSGTGKTTCCLYRLWDHYVIYWKRANISGTPLIQKPVTNSLTHIRDNKATGYHDKAEESDDAQSEDDVNDTDDDDDDDDDDNETEDKSENYCHLHQLFISRNNCLCTEMQKNFKNLCTGENMSENHMEFSGQCFQDLQDNNFPLFLTSKKFWVLLDASLGSPYFFPRNEDTSLKTDFKNWLDEDSNNLFEMDIKENDISGNVQEFYEVTYDVFEREFWNRIKYPVPDCHPTLIWTEIMSIIKGSYKSLLSEKGFLSKDEYFEIGKKQAPNFTSDREKVYQAFMKYNKLLKERRLFDEMDVVFNLFSRLRNFPSTLCPIHEIYVDEVQDFTQAELFLMILLVDNPNNMFLTGDTAQSIMRGVAFRFCDLKSLFYYLKEICSNLKQLHSIKVPQKMHYLTCNYRSHSGVVSLASSVLDLLNRYFPESFDKTEKDYGTYQGPKPQIFEFCDNDHLAMLLGGERHATDLIEFGAQQAILVANNEAKQELPSFLSSAIVLTIAESKGLEFNDILLYNFFKDSQATDEWRIITSYLNELIAQNNNDSQGNGQRSTELNLDVINSENHPHPLIFDPNKHKVLNSDLKYLYTALTRAKHKIWIFDISTEKRTPVFEYFQVFRLVESVDTSREDPDKAAFARSSTPEEWFKKGMSFFERKYFEIAIKCFQKSGHKKEENIATAFQYIQQAQTQNSAGKKRKHFLIASKYFFDSNMCIRSAWCLSEGGKYELSAHLYQKCHKYKEAAVNFKNAKMYDEAVHCYIKISLYSKAVDVLHDAKQYSRAIELVQEYKELEQSYGDSAPEDFVKNCPTKDICYLAQQAANIYYQCKDYENMKRALLHFTTLEDQLNFLEKKRLFKDAAELLRNNGQLQASINLLWRNNLISESVEVAAALNDNNLYADCLYKRAGRNYVLAKLKTMRVTTPMSSTAADSVSNGDCVDVVDIDADLSRKIEEDLNKAQLLYKKEGNNFGLGKCHLLFAKLNEGNTTSTNDAVEAFKQFKSAKVMIGCLEAVQFFTDIHPDNFYKESFWNVIKESFNLISRLKCSQQNSNLLIKSYLPYFGLSFKDDFVWKSHTTEPLCCISLIEYNICYRSSYASFTFDKFKSWLHKYLKFSIKKLFEALYQKLIIHIIISTPCPFESEELCQSSKICRCHLADFYRRQFSQSKEVVCRFRDKKCMHLHKSSALPEFDIRVLICQMLLTIKLRDNYEEFEFLITHLYKTLISNSDQSIHLSDCFHPDNITALKTCVREHVKMVFQEKSLLEKVQSSDFYFKVNILFSWLNITYDVEKFMKMLYDQIEKESFPKVSILNSSLICSDNIYMCIYQRFYDSLYFLYEKQHPFEAVIQFSKFCVLFQKKAKRILPDLNCLLVWIEFFMTVSLMLLMRHCKIPVVIPSSYISTIDLIDTLQPTSSIKLENILNSSHMWLVLNLLQKRVAMMVNLIFSEKIFQCKDAKSKKVTERVFILGLTYIHCFSEYPFKNIPDLNFLMLCKDVTTLAEDPSLRVKDICELIPLNKAEACRLIKGTVKVLMLTPKYKMSRYYWMFKSGKPVGLVSDKQMPIMGSEVDNASPTIVPEIDSQVSEKMVEVLINKDEEDKMNDFVMQTEAVQVIEKAYLRYRNKLLNELRSLQIPVNLPIVSPSEEYCPTCATSFSSKQWITPFKINVSNNGSCSSDGKETVFEHLKKPAHSAKISEFQQFSKLYETDFLPVKEKFKTYLDLASDNEEITFYLSSLKLKLQEFDKIINQICENANWTETEKLEILVRNIQYFAEKIIRLHENSELSGL